MTIDVRFFGTFHLTHNGQGIDAINGSHRLQALLAYLLLHHATPQPRQQIAYHFWPVSEESQARTNLRKLFLQLRRALPDADRYLTFDNQTIRWRADAAFTCDVLDVQQRLKQLRDNPLDQATLTAIFDLYRGELLPNCYDDWIMPVRVQLHTEVMAAIEQMITLLENQRAYGEGIRYAQRLLSFDPLEEKSYQRLMRLRAFDGDRAGALKIYQECTEILERELGVAPSPEANALYEQLRQAKRNLAPPPAQPSTKLDLPPLIGRQSEWQLLRTVWQQAARGQARFVTVAGEAGIGKTRLAEELLLWAEGQGIAAVRTRSYQAQGALAYAPIAELLQAETMARRVQLLNENRLTQVARLLPKLLEEHPNLPPPQPMTESWQRQQFFDALAHAILAKGQPLVLLFDDLQWADGETLTWLHFLLRAAENLPLLLVGTVRTGEIDSEHPLPTLLNSLRRDDLLTEIVLAPLNAEEVQTLAQSLRDGALADDQLAQLYADTEGNPLFVVESVRAQQNSAGDQGQGAKQSGLPPKIYSVIRSRLTHLSPETQTLVNLAAVIGRSFTYDVLMEASAMGEEAVVDSLDELLKRQIVREQGGDSYDFSHDRIRDVAYNEISRTRRRLLHRRVAEALASVNKETLDVVCGELAFHYQEAAAFEQAIVYYQRAAMVAFRLFAMQEVEHLCRQGMRLLHTIPSFPQAQDVELMFLMMLSTAVATARGYAVAGLKALYEQALALLPSTDPDGRAVPLYYGLWSYHFLSGSFDEADTLTELMSTQAEVLGEPFLLELSCHGRGMTAMYRSDFAVALTYFSQSLHFSQASAAPGEALQKVQTLTLMTFLFQALTLALQGFADQARAIIRQAQQQQAWRTPVNGAATHTLSAILYVLLRDRAATLASAQAVLEICARHDLPYWRIVAVIPYLWARFDQSTEQAHELALFTQTLADLINSGTFTSVPFSYMLLAEMQGQTGQFDAALLSIEKGLSVVAETGESWCEAGLYCVRGDLLLGSNNLQDGEASLQRALVLGQQQGSPMWQLRAAVHLARFYRQQGQDAQAYTLLAPIYATLSEGFDTLDAQEARHLLNALAAPHSALSATD